MKTKVCITLRILLILLVVATVAHAFYQSSLPVKKSAENSSKVGEIIEEIIPPDTKPGEYVQKNLRKLAHFAEFFMLGVWTSLYVMFFFRSKYAYVLILPFGMITALLDETVQIFSKRGASVTDVWIDVLGYATALLVASAVFFFVLLIKYLCSKQAVSEREG